MWRRHLASWCLFLAGGCAPDQRAVAPAEVVAAPVYVRVAGKLFAVTVGEVENIKVSGDPARYYSPHDEDRGASDAARLAHDGGQRSSPIDAEFLTITPGNAQGTLQPCRATPSAWRCRILTTRLAIRDLPQRVTFVEPAYAMKNLRTATVGGEDVSHQLRSIAPFDARPKLACDRTSKFCTAAVALSPTLLAVWTVWADDNRGRDASPVDMAERQGRVIAALAAGR